MIYSLLRYPNGLEPRRGLVDDGRPVLGRDLLDGQVADVLLALELPQRRLCAA